MCKPGSTGQHFGGVHNIILDPDEEGSGEIAVKSRNVFMGYHKDQAKTEESFQVICKIFLDNLAKKNHQSRQIYILCITL